MTMPHQEANIILLEQFSDYFSGVFWKVVLLELPLVVELELLCGFLQVFIKDLYVKHSLSQAFLYPDTITCALGREASA